MATNAVGGHGGGNPSTGNEKPRKQQRVSQACDKCHHRSIRCRPSAENPTAQCQACYDFGIECLYNRPSRRKRQIQNQPSPSRPHPNLPPISQPSRTSSYQTMASRPSNTQSSNSGASSWGDGQDYTGAYTKVREGRPGDSLDVAWRSFALASLDSIEHLMTIYMNIIYPIYPLFHEPTLWRRLKLREHLTDKGFFASIMAACALASARARDGALGDAQAMRAKVPDTNAEIWFSTAQDTIGSDLSQAQGIGYLKACALLAVTSIQFTQKKLMHQFLGHFMTLSAMQGFHDEAQWPQDCDDIEKEERRRLFWSMYCFDVYSTVVFNGLLKAGETNAHVRYPREINDGDLAVGVSDPPTQVVWLQGWNFTVDLYRMLEHTVQHLRRGGQTHNDSRMSVTDTLVRDNASDSQIMDSALAFFARLPQCFQSYSDPPDGSRSHDIFGFQAANIQATLQLLRITHFSMSPAQDVYQKCGVAEQVLKTFHAVHPFYLQAISTPLAYHLGGVGHILSSVMEGPICEESYGSIRALLVSMSELLQTLESGLQPTIGASKSLKAQIERIDEYVDKQRRIISSFTESQQFPNNQHHPTVIMGPNAGSSAQRGFNNVHNVSELPVPQQPPSFMGDGAGSGATAIPPQQQSMGITSATDEFHLPSDLVSDWPWPFNFTTDYGFVDGGPMAGIGW